MAFGLTSILAVSAGIVGWLGFGRIAENQRNIIQGAIPAMVNAQNLAEATAKIVATASSLAQAKIQVERILATAKLEKYRVELLILLGSLPKNGFDYETVTSLGSLAGHLLENLKQQEELVDQRIRISRKRDVVATELLNAAAAIGPLLSVESLFDLSESQDELSRQSAVQEVSGLSEEEISRLRVNSVKMVSVLNQLSRERDLIVINYLQSEFLLNLNSLSEKTKKIKNHESRRALDEKLLLILKNSRPIDDGNVFDLHRKLRKLDVALSDLDNKNSGVAVGLNSEIGDLMRKGSDTINSEMLLSEDAIIFGRNIFIAVTIGSILFIVFILWFYVQTAVRRLLALESGMGELAKGNYDIDIDVSKHGNDELALMANTVQIFKEYAIERESLQKAQKETERTLRKHKFNLEKLVEARTRELQEVNRELAEKAIAHLDARQIAERASQVKTDFLATMSHELRTPMSGLLGVINLIKDTGPSKQQGKYLDTLDVIAHTLLEILDDILGYSQIEAGKLLLSNADFDIRTVIGDMVEVLKPVADNKLIYIRADIAPEVPHMLYGDAGKLRQILLNIIGNGIKFTDKGGVRLNVIRQPSTNNSDVRLLFGIEDTGIGIPKQLQKDVFEAFNQGVMSISQQYGGTGLGLAICKRLVTLMGGEIDCESTPGVGSVFTFALDFRESQTFDVEADDFEAVPDSQCVGELSILLVEDDPTNRMVLRSYLEKSNHRVSEAVDGEEAVLMATNNDFDVVLMDLRMPRLNGVEAAKRIRALPAPRSSVPIIAVSAHTNPNKLDDYVGGGMNGFIAKPVDLVKLYEVLYQVVVQKVKVIPQAPVEGDSHSPDESCYELLLQDVEFIGIEKTRAKIDLFLSSSRQTLGEIKQAAENKDRNAVREYMHKLKGAASAVGLLSLASHAGEMEKFVYSEAEGFGSKLVSFEKLYDLSCDLLVKSFEEVPSELPS